MTKNRLIQNLLTIAGMCLPLATTVDAQIGAPLDPNEYLREITIVEGSGHLFVTCLGTDNDDQVKVIFNNASIEVELNGKTKSIPMRAGNSVDVKIVGFNGDDELIAVDFGNARIYDIDEVQMHGRGGDDHLSCLVNASASMTGGLGSDHLYSDCLLEYLCGDEILETKAGIELAADFRNDKVAGYGLASVFVQIAEGRLTASGSDWQIAGPDDTNEDPTAPDDVVTLFATTSGSSNWYRYLDSTYEENWLKYAPF